MNSCFFDVAGYQHPDDVEEGVADQLFGLPHQEKGRIGWLKSRIVGSDGVESRGGVGEASDVASRRRRLAFGWRRRDNLRDVGGGGIAQHDIGIEQRPDCFGERRELLERRRTDDADMFDEGRLDPREGVLQRSEMVAPFDQKIEVDLLKRPFDEADIRLVFFFARFTSPAAQKIHSVTRSHSLSSNKGA